MARKRRKNRERGGGNAGSRLFFFFNENMNMSSATDPGLSIFWYPIAGNSLLVKCQHSFQTIPLTMLGKVLGLQDKC